MTQPPEERVHVVDYDPAWPARFEAERALLERVVAPWLEGGVHHVGSTAVPGLAAKPVVDIMVGVRDLEEARAASVLASIWNFEWNCKLLDKVLQTVAAFKNVHLIRVEALVATAEAQARIGDVPGALKNVADTYENELAIALRVVTNMIEPVMIMIMAAGVGFLLMSVLSAMFAITANIAR